MSTPAPRPRPAAPAARPAPAAPAPAARPAAQAPVQQQAPQQPAEQGGGEPPPATEAGTKFMMFSAVPSWLVSFVMHVVLLIIMGLITFSNDKGDPPLAIVSEKLGTEEEDIVEIEDKPITPLQVAEVQPDTPLDAVADAIPDEVTEISPANDADAAPATTVTDPLGSDAAPRNDMLREVGAFSGTGLEGRGKASRAKAIAQGGGSAGSEEAVARALKWLAAHQMPDGGWSFDHRGGACQGRCRNQGSMAEARNGATGLALLPFLGAGQTHKEGQYKQVVEKGLYFLLRSMKVKGGQTGELSEAGGNMYSHGICSIVLCEAYAMTHDKGLMQPAQLAINHIVFAQDPVGGGWRYTPKQAGDTSVVGWQLMALKSGHMAYLRVPPETVKLASKFLDSVQVDYSQYGYTAPAAGHHATTAVGLLCRMYLGWKHDHPGIIGGVKILDPMGPNFGNMYYSYYATQVVRHYDGEEWKRWNAKMRDPLIALQAKNGHEEGSWFMAGGGDHGFGVGGRLYCTAMATMMLEVYYRHMPIYQKAATKEDFAL